MGEPIAPHERKQEVSRRMSETDETCDTQNESEQQAISPDCNDGLMVDGGASSHEEVVPGSGDEPALSGDSQSLKYSNCSNAPQHEFRIANADMYVPSTSGLLSQTSSGQLRRKRHEADSSRYNTNDDDANIPPTSGLLSQTSSGQQQRKRREADSTKNSTNDDDAGIELAVPPPTLSRHDGIRRVSTPGAFRSRLHRSNSSDDDDTFSTSSSYAEESGNAQSMSTSRSAPLSDGIPTESASAAESSRWDHFQSQLAHRSRGLYPPGSFLSRSQQSFSTTAVEATLVTSHHNVYSWNDSIYPPPPGLPVATASDEIICAEVIHYSGDKGVAVTTPTCSYRRTRCLYIVVVFMILLVAIFVSTQLARISKGDSGESDRSDESDDGIPYSISHHAVVLGGSTTCDRYRTGKLRLYCGGITAVNDSLATIELRHSSNNTMCKAVGNNSLVCKFDELEEDGPYSSDTVGIVFSCARQSYVDESRVAAGAFFGVDVADECVTNRSSFANDTMNSSTVPYARKFMGLGHFCRIRDPDLGTIKWSLERSIVVQNGVLLPDQCESENATFVNEDNLLLNYCYLNSTTAECTPNATSRSNTSTVDVPSSCSLKLNELKATDSFSKCHDSQLMNDDLTDQFKTLVEVAVGESQSLLSLD